MHAFLRSLCCLMTGATLAFADAPPDSIDAGVHAPELLERLKRGEVIIENARTDETGGAVRAQALMQGSLAALWGYIASCKHVALYLQGLRDCELLSTRVEGDDDISEVRQAVKSSWITPTISYTMEVRRQPPDRIDFRLLGGELDELEGGWRFVETGDGLLVTHEIRVRPSYPLPRWVVRRSMRDDIPDMLACLRGLIDASGEWDRDRDLKRCPRKGRDRN